MTAAPAPDPVEPTEPHPLCTPDEAAELLRVSRTTVYVMIRKGELQPTRVRGRTFIHRDDLARYLAPHAPTKRRAPRTPA